MKLLLAFLLGYFRGVTDGAEHERRKQRRDYTV